VFCGLLIFILPIKLPKIIYNAFDLIANTNTPIAMILLGTYIAKTYNFVCFIKLILIPIIILKFLPQSLGEIKKVVLIAMCTPVGLTVPMLSQLYGGDYEYGAKLVGLSTILSLVTIPIVLYLADVV
jgi:predicted permease